MGVMAVALVPQQRGRRGLPALPMRLSADLRRIRLTWSPPVDAARFVVHGRPIREGPAGAQPAGAPRLLAEVAEETFAHIGLSPHGESWEYVVQAVDEWGSPCAQSDPVVGSSSVSVTVAGHPVVSVGSFDGGSKALTLTKVGYARYRSTFPDDVDFTYGQDDPATAWSWLQPGPDDAWAGRRTHRFRLRFRMDAPPPADLDLAVWLTDRHPTRAGAAAVLINEQRCDPVLFADQGVGTPESATDVPGHGAGPGYYEQALPAPLFRAGENVLEIVKDQGSWIAYDALGLFARA